MTIPQQLESARREYRKPQVKDYGTLEGMTKDSDEGKRPESFVTTIVWGNDEDPVAGDE